MGHTRIIFLLTGGGDAARIPLITTIISPMTHAGLRLALLTRSQARPGRNFGPFPGPGLGGLIGAVLPHGLEVDVLSEG